MAQINIRELKEAVAEELVQRKVEGGWAQQRGGPAELYGATGVVNSMAVLGLPMDVEMRNELIKVILSYQTADGTFQSKDAAHAMCMAVQSLNLLKAPIPANVGPLAPTDPAPLKEWLAKLNWSSTHKELWGRTAPLLADGAVSAEWSRIFAEDIAAHLSPDKPLQTWCAEDADPWRVISCLYHVLQSFDAGGLPYPQPDLILDRLWGLNWPERRPNSSKTKCTDADWAWLLAQLGNQLPGSLEKSLPQIRAVAEQRTREWNEKKVDLAKMTTHDIYCDLWSTAAYQNIARDYFAGPYLYDTLNDPALFRLGRTIRLHSTN